MGGAPPGATVQDVAEGGPSMKDAGADLPGLGEAGAKADGGADSGPGAPRSCASNTWCPDTTAPAGYRIHGVWGSSSNDVWFAATSAAGAGALLRHTAAGWSAPIPISHGEPWRLCGSGPNDVWALGGDGTGSGNIHHFNGATWQDRTPAFGAESELNSMVACSAASPTDVWLVDSVGTYQSPCRARVVIRARR